MEQENFKHKMDLKLSKYSCKTTFITNNIGSSLYMNRSASKQKKRPEPDVEVEDVEEEPIKLELIEIQGDQSKPHTSEKKLRNTRRERFVKHPYYKKNLDLIIASTT